MKTLLRLGVAGLLLAIALALASCAGGSEGAQQEGNDSSGNGGSRNGGMQGMDHGSMGGEEMARQMLEGEDGKYSDERFIDAMVPHHQSAIEMAQVAREKSNIPEIKELAQNIISAQQAEIEQMKQWRNEWYPQR
jgi:uncharacterized protein (DUF305 family)